MEDFLFRYIIDYISNQTKHTNPTVVMDATVLEIRFRNGLKYKITIDTLETTRSDSDYSQVLTESQIISLLTQVDEPLTVSDNGAPLGDSILGIEDVPTCAPLSVVTTGTNTDDNSDIEFSDSVEPVTIKITQSSVFDDNDRNDSDERE